MSKFGGALKKLGSLQAQAQELPQENLNTGKPENVHTGKPENRDAGKPENRDTGKPEHLIYDSGPEREKYSTFLDRELITALKLHAVRHRMKHHQVVEAALRRYLDQEGES
ncbi:hypothetical protein [Deinococcus yunweiensis]|uniref:hypothetical protein n=1 Tax=Deinococcus yunweiensis TaxID=367282 RepID=UPI00398E3F08